MPTDPAHQAPDNPDNKETEISWYKADSIEKVLTTPEILDKILKEHDGYFISAKEQERDDSMLLSACLNKVLCIGQARTPKNALAAKNKKLEIFYDNLKEFYDDARQEALQKKGKVSDSEIARKFNEAATATFEKEGRWHHTSISRLRRYYERQEQSEKTGLASPKAPDCDI